MGFTNLTERKILDFFFGKAALTAPITINVGLCTGITDTGTMVNITGEPSGKGYQRVAVANNKTNWESAVTEGTPKKSMVANKVEIQFPEATTSWGELSHFFLHDGDAVFAWAELTTAKEVDAGDVPRFKAGELVAKLYGV